MCDDCPCPYCNTLLIYDTEHGWDYWHEWFHCPGCGENFYDDDFGAIINEDYVHFKEDEEE